MKPLIHRFAAFKPLKDEPLFACVQVDAGGYGVAWNDDIDLSCDELWENGMKSLGFINILHFCVQASRKSKTAFHDLLIHLLVFNLYV